MNPEVEPVPLGPAEIQIEAVVDAIPAIESTNGFSGILASLCSMHEAFDRHNFGDRSSLKYNPWTPLHDICIIIWSQPMLVLLYIYSTISSKPTGSKSG